MISNSDCDWDEIEAQIRLMRDFCQHNAPEKLELFEMVYESRFRRLRETWRENRERHKNMEAGNNE